MLVILDNRITTWILTQKAKPFFYEEMVREINILACKINELNLKLKKKEKAYLLSNSTDIRIYIKS